MAGHTDCGTDVANATHSNTSAGTMCCAHFCTMYEQHLVGSNRLRISLGTLALRLYWALAGKAQQIPAMAFLYLQVFTPVFHSAILFLFPPTRRFFFAPPTGDGVLRWYANQRPTAKRLPSVASFFSLQRATHGGSSVRPCSEMLNLAEAFKHETL